MLGLNRKKDSVQTPTSNSIYYHEDHAFKTLSEATVGRKGLSLFQLKQFDIPVPDFFVVSPVQFKDFVVTAFQGKVDSFVEKLKSGNTKDFEKLLMKSDFSLEFKESLLSNYARLSGFSNAWVAVRSSVVSPANPNVSFSGVYHSALNVRGYEDLLTALKEVYMSAFADRAVEYARNHSTDLSEIQIAVVVQKMIQPEVSGVSYTVDPVTNDSKRIGVEAVFGLGDVIADGSITPDQYIVEKDKFTISEKHIAPQEWMKIRKLTGKSRSAEQYEKIRISKAWSHQQKLEDRFIEEVARLSAQIEQRAKAPQNIEWLFESGRVWVVQTKEVVAPVTKEERKAEVVPAPLPNKQTPIDFALNTIKDRLPISVKNESNKVADLQPPVTTLQEAETPNTTESDQVETSPQFSEKELRSLERWKNRLALFNSKKEEKVAVKEKQLEKEQTKLIEKLGVLDDIDESNMTFLMTGIGSSHGEVVGIVEELSDSNYDKLVVSKNTILVAKKYNKEFESLIYKVAGVVLEEGGLTSDVSILSREIGIPCIVGATNATALLADGDIIKIDGNVGSIYKYIGDSSKKAEQKAATEQQDSGSKQQEKAPLSLSKSVAETIAPAATSVPVTATKVYAHINSKNTPLDIAKYIHFASGIIGVDLDSYFLEQKRHILSHVENKTYKDVANSIELAIDSICEVARGDEVIVTLGSGTVGQYKAQIKGATYENSVDADTVNGTQRYLNNKKFLAKALSIIKKLRNTYQNRNISVAIENVGNGQLMQEIKKELSAVGLRRTSTFKIYAYINSASDVILAQDIASAGIDGFIFNAPAVYKSLTGKKLGIKEFTEADSTSLSSTLKMFLTAASIAKLPVVAISTGNTQLTEMMVDLGVNAIATTLKTLETNKQAIATQEAKKFMRF